MNEIDKVIDELQWFRSVLRKGGKIPEYYEAQVDILTKAIKLLEQPERKIDGDLISRQAAMDAVRKCTVKEVTPAYMLIDKAEVMTELMLLPSAERLRGEWIVYKAPDKQHCGLVKCPFCGEDMIAEADEYNFCPNCGADMRGKTDG